MIGQVAACSVGALFEQKAPAGDNGPMHDMGEIRKLGNESRATRSRVNTEQVSCCHRARCGRCNFSSRPRALT